MSSPAENSAIPEVKPEPESTVIGQHIGQGGAKGHAELLALARRVAAHFEDTDAPLGIAARAAIAKAEG